MPPAVAGSQLGVLDGIRGWACLMVLLFHVLSETNRAPLPELDTSLVAVICDGPPAVCVFLILSGEARSAGDLRCGDLGIVRTLATRRHARLSMPIPLASALVGRAMVNGLNAHHATAGPTGDRMPARLDQGYTSKAAAKIGRPGVT